jgi:CheY-like chemotaxis protein
VVNIKADPNQIEQILLNLAVNARDAMPRGGALTIEAESVSLSTEHAAERLDLPPGGYAVIAVSDTGVGMDEETRQRVFEPFFTTKDKGEGTGLGLSTVFGIVKQAGGSVWVDSAQGRGTTFKLYFPLTDERLSSPPPPPSMARATQGGVVLVVEDDEQLRDVVTRILESAAYDVLSAGHPNDALDKARAFDGQIDLLLTDVLMPGMSGKQLAERLLLERPGAAVLYMSGYAENVVAHHGVLEKGVDFISKPVTQQRLVAAIERVLSRRPEG